MKKRDLIEVKNLEVSGLIKKAQDLKQEIADLLMDKNMDKVKDLKSIFKKRKDLAQVLTVLRQKQLLMELESKVLVNVQSKNEETKSKKEVK